MVICMIGSAEHWLFHTKYNSHILRSDIAPFHDIRHARSLAGYAITAKLSRSASRLGLVQKVVMEHWEI